jgi:type I restriction enzyme S subunit
MFDSGVVVPRKGSLGNPQLVLGPFWPTDTTFAVLPSGATDTRWLYYCLLNYDLPKLNEATGVPSISREWLSKIRFFNPGQPRQSRIADILQTIDRAIEKTEALIEKYQQIKAGLMHDLFTRGIGPDGHLRPPREQAPELYQKTPIGWIPKEWEILGVSDVLESIVDGPFGSNLKTEHYVQDPGVRVVRLQNVLEYEYNDADRAYISENHASMLIRNKVVADDVLIAGLGEKRFPVGRSCYYPENFPFAINKADCFRARCVPEIALNKFFMLFLNSVAARNQIRKFEQGVTRPRINTGNLKRLRVSVPPLDEQRSICAHFESIQQRIGIERTNLEKLQKQKSGLMHDLLTGEVEVNVSEATYA